jgi:hypothetical protein
MYNLAPSVLKAAQAVVGSRIKILTKNNKPSQQKKARRVTNTRRFFDRIPYYGVDLAHTSASSSRGRK